MKNMSSWIQIPGFPPPEKQDNVQFHVLKGLPYSSRMLLYILLLVSGFSIQLFMLTAWPGALLLVFAAALNLVRGFDSRVRLNTFRADSSWTDVDMDRIHEVKRLDDKITKWDRDGLDISNITGIAVFMVAVIAIFVFSMLLAVLTTAAVGTIFIVDAAILILPMWFNGIRRVLKQDNLRVKTGIITTLEEHFKKIKKEGEHFRPALMLARNEKEKTVPTDARFTISFDAMPASFYGIQAQININVIQGSSYPYFYCVIPAGKGFGLEGFVEQIPRRRNILIEFQQDKDAEVIVIRQATTKTSGYETNIHACRMILETTLEAARTILEARRGQG